MFTPFRLKRPIGEAFNMESDDTLNTKKALARLGHMKVPEHGLTEFPDRPMLDAVKSFQREQGLKVDGEMQPDGETTEKLNHVIREQSKIENLPENYHDQVELAFAPAVPIGIAFAEWLMGVLPAATVAAAMAVFAASSKPRQQELRKQYQEETGNDDDAEDHCHQRWVDERDACYFRAPEWQGKCKERARYRFTLCRENGGVPDPNEPPEWSKADEVVSFNPDR